jgi:intracellular sulfur oxidation DsrE/DsrF family protein
VAKTLFHLFHKDGASLSLGSTAALRSGQRSGETGVEVEVLIFGSAQKVLSDPAEEGPPRTFNRNVDGMIASGIPVWACVKAAEATGTDGDLVERGIILVDAVAMFARCAREGVSIVTF